MIKIIERLKGINRKKALYWGSFLLPMAVVQLVWVFFGLYPFGEMSLLTNDFNLQFIDLYEYFQTVFRSGDLGNFFYSFSKSIGGAMIGVWGFSMNSPLNFLLLLVPRFDLLIGLTYVILLRIGLMSLTMCHYLMRRHPARPGRGYLVLIMSMGYALSGMIMAYQIHPIFFDAMIMTPLIILYLEEWLDGGKPYKYMLSLAALMFLHFYFGFITSIFVALYTLAYVFGRQPVKSRQAWFLVFKTGGLSALAVASMSWFLLPVYRNLLLSRGTYAAPLVVDPNFQFNPLDLFAKLMMGAVDEGIFPRSGSYNLPYIYVSGLAVLGFFLFWLLPKVASRREKMAMGLLSLFMIYSLSNDFLDKLWHMGQEPNGTYYRFSWLFSWLILVLAYRAFNTQEPSPKQKVNYRNYLVSFTLLVFAWVIRNPEGYNFFWDNQTVELTNTIFPYISLPALVLLRLTWGTVFKRSLSRLGLTVGLLVFALIAQEFQLFAMEQTATILVWLLLISLLFCLPQKIWVSFLVLGISMMELGVNSFITYKKSIYDNAYSYMSGQRIEQEMVAEIAPSNQEFYRISELAEFRANVPLANEFPGLGHYSSNMERSTLNLFNALGQVGEYATTYYIYSNYVTDSFLGVRYLTTPIAEANTKAATEGSGRVLYSDDDRKDIPDQYSKVLDTSRFHVYENTDSLPLGFGVPDAAVETDFPNFYAPDNYSLLLSALAGREVSAYEEVPFNHITMENLTVREDEDGRTWLDVIDTDLLAKYEVTITPETDQAYYLTIPAVIGNMHFAGDDFLKDGQDFKYLSLYEKGLPLHQIAYKQAGQSQVYTAIIDYRSSVDITDYKAVTLNIDQARAVYQERQKQGLTISDRGSNFVKGTVDITDQSSHMLVTIPYNKGWKVKVDGQLVETKSAIGDLLSFPITAGHHEIEMVFIPDGWELGWLISSLSILTILLIFKGKAILAVIKSKKS